MGTYCVSRFSQHLSNQGLTQNLGQIVRGTSDSPLTTFNCLLDLFFQGLQIANGYLTAFDTD